MIYLEFTKMHGLGNDYVVINCLEDKNYIEKSKISQIVKYLCNRNFGVGADGVLFVESSEIADFKMNIYNSDGTIAQMCGNGIRCFSKYIYDNKITEKTEIKIETLAGIKTAYLKISQRDKCLQEITIDMGSPILESEKIPVLLDESKDIQTSKVSKVNIQVLDKQIEAFCVSMGNPHAVVFYPNPDEININKIGSIIETDKHFPEKTNVEFIQVLGPSSIKMRVWERGVGETFACGTGACAVSVVCNKLGFTRKQVKVYLKGGELKIYFDDSENKVYMTGIATKVFDGNIYIDL